MNEENEQLGGNPVETPIDHQEEDENKTQTETTEEEQPKTDTEEQAEKLFNQGQVDEFITNRLNRLYKRYGAENKAQLDEMVGKAQSYDIMKERYEGLSNENSQLKEQIAFLKNSISPERYDDVRAYFKGKGLEFNNDNLVQELNGHPEWRTIVENDKPKTTITKLSPDRGANIESPDTELQQVFKMFGL